MEGKIWSKFHPLFGPDLKVGFETTFPAVTVLDLLDPRYEKNGLIHYQPKKPIVRVCEPATKIVGSCVDGQIAQVFFEPAPQKESLYRRLVFARKIDHSSQKPRLWVVAARHGEIATFGFDSWNSKDHRYLALAYPGESVDGQFMPVFFKIQRKEGGFVYLEVWGMDDEVQFLVTARRIEESAAPEQLRTAMPDEGTEDRVVFSI